MQINSERLYFELYGEMNDLKIIQLAKSIFYRKIIKFRNKVSFQNTRFMTKIQKLRKSRKNDENLKNHAFYDKKVFLQKNDNNW